MSKVAGGRNSSSEIGFIDGTGIAFDFRNVVGNDYLDRHGNGIAIGIARGNAEIQNDFVIWIGAVGMIQILVLRELVRARLRIDCQIKNLHAACNADIGVADDGDINLHAVVR